MHAGWLICCVVLGSDAKPIVVDSALLTVAEQAEVPARDSGLLVEIAVREGDSVTAGARIARLDDTEAKLAELKAAIDLKRAQTLAANDIKVRLAKVDLAYAKSELKRATEAAQKLANSVSDAEFDRLRANVDRAALELEQAQFELDAAKLAVTLIENELQVAQAKLRQRNAISPISGTVVAIPKRLGEWAESGQVVARVLSTAKFRAEFFVKSDQALQSLVGKTVHFKRPEVGGQEQAFVGRVTFVSPEVDPLNGQVRVWAEVENVGGLLRPGLTGSLTISP